MVLLGNKEEEERYGKYGSFEHLLVLFSWGFFVVFFISNKSHGVLQPLCPGQPLGHHRPRHRRLRPPDLPAVAAGESSTVPPLACLPCAAGPQRVSHAVAERGRPCVVWLTCSSGLTTHTHGEKLM